MSQELRHYALQCLRVTTVQRKIEMVLFAPLQLPIDAAKEAAEVWAEDATPFTAATPLPGRPARPHLVAPDQLPQRSVQTEPGLVSLLHAICHIEFNAVLLALDAVWRFAQMPPAFYHDWFGIAQEEAQHFLLLQRQLQTLQYDYGDFDAHNGLWDMCERTAHDVLVRMALVPRLLEARGLDVTPGIQDKLRAAKHTHSADILDIILRDEIGHVRVGNHWFHYLCEQRNCDPVTSFEQFMQAYRAPHIRPPLNRPARQIAGFSQDELAWLDGQIELR